jgi:hypothetical protein
MVPIDLLNDRSEKLANVVDYSWKHLLKHKGYVDEYPA